MCMSRTAGIAAMRVDGLGDVGLESADVCASVSRSVCAVTTASPCVSRSVCAVSAVREEGLSCENNHSATRRAQYHLQQANCSL